MWATVGGISSLFNSLTSVLNVPGALIIIVYRLHSLCTWNSTSTNVFFPYVCCAFQLVRVTVSKHVVRTRTLLAINYSISNVCFCFIFANLCTREQTFPISWNWAENLQHARLVDTVVSHSMQKRVAAVFFGDFSSDNSYHCIAHKLLLLLPLCNELTYIFPQSGRSPLW